MNKSLISFDAYQPLYERAVEIGQEKAKECLRQEAAFGPREWLWRLGIDIVAVRTSKGNCEPFACFYEPNRVEVCEGIGERVCALFRSDLPEVIAGIDFEQLLLAHELFHVLQFQQANPFFERAFRLKPFFTGRQRRRKLHSLEEVAAMAFTQRLLETTCSPCVFEVLMMYVFRADDAGKLCDKLQILDAAMACADPC